MDKNSKIIIYSSYKLSEEEIKATKEKFNFPLDRQVVNLIDKTIISGMVIIFDGMRIDLSIKTMLKNLEKKLYEFSK